MGLVVGRTAAKTTVPTIIDFLRKRSDPVDADSALARSAADVDR
jgi:polyhydroxyalkanoate synthase